MEQLAHHANPALSSRKARKVFTDRVEDPAIKVQLLPGAEKTVNEALMQTLEMQAMLLAARPRKMSARTFWGADCPYLMKRHKMVSMLELWGTMPLPR
jgi:hypothetical protein